jgi:hypothetical protein
MLETLFFQKAGQSERGRRQPRLRFLVYRVPQATRIQPFLSQTPEPIPGVSDSYVDLFGCDYLISFAPKARDGTWHVGSRGAITQKWMLQRFGRIRSARQSAMFHILRAGMLLARGKAAFAFRKVPFA